MNADKVLLIQMKDNLVNNPELTSKIKHNSKNKIAEVFPDYFVDELNNLLDGNLNFYNKIIGNQKIKTFIQKQILNIIYEEQTPNQQDLF
jgi:hypothetical protein